LKASISFIGGHADKKFYFATNIFCYRLKLFVTHMGLWCKSQLHRLLSRHGNLKPAAIQHCRAVLYGDTGAIVGLRACFLGVAVCGVGAGWRGALPMKEKKKQRRQRKK
jgi:hypothetical protein